MPTPPSDRSSFPKRIPAPDEDPAELLELRDRWFNFDSAYRNREMERMALGIYYALLDRQWVESDLDVVADGVRGYTLRDVVYGNPNLETRPPQMPQPVTNYIAPAVEIEVAHFTDRELTANVIPTSNDPEIRKAVKKAKEILEYRQRVNNWPDLREHGALIDVVCGTVVYKSFWDEKYTDLTYISPGGAKQCPACKYKVASDTFDQEEVDRFKETGLLTDTEGLEDVPPAEGEDKLQARMRRCPTCHGELQDYDPDQDEVEFGVDQMGRKFGKPVPKGNTAIEIVSPFDLFPENTGVDIEPTTCRVWGQATPRSLDWIEERYPERFDEIVPDSPYELMKYHPVLGEWQLLGRFDARMDSNVYDNHCRVYELHAKPSYRFPKGRSIVIAGDVVLEDGELVREVKTKYGTLRVPRVLYAGARFKAVPKHFWGRGLPDILISPQNRLNGIDSQTIEARERMGSPNILVSEDMDLSGPEWFEGYGGGKVMKYTPSPLNPAAKPEPFGSILMPVGAFQERQATVQDMKELAGPQDVEQGEAPRNVSTTSGLQILGEQSEKKRGPRVRPLIQVYEAIWKHQLDLIWALRSEPDEYEVEEEDGTYRTEEFDRTAIAAQTKVKVEKQAYIDKSIYQKEAAREAQIDGLYRIDSPAAVKRLLELRGLPTDVNEDQNRQVECAEEKWTRFVEFGEVPPVDTSLDDFQIHFQVLGTELKGLKGLQLQRESGWLQAIKPITGWEDELSRMEVLDQQAVAAYGSRFIDPQQAAEQYAMMMNTYTAGMEAQQTAQMTGMPDVVGGGAPLQPPPPPIFLPAAMEDRIVAVWNQLLQRAGVQVEPTFLAFRAVVEAYRLYAQRMALGANPGAPAAPGMAPLPQGGAISGGTMPQPPVPPKPGQPVNG